MWMLENLDWQVVLRDLVKLSFAYLLALPIAWNRERADRSAGLRTFPLVAVATCGYMVAGFQVLDSTEAHGRVVQGLITGMGFIGGGAILKYEGGVQGTATAASLWATGAIGFAIAAERIEVALVLSLVTFLTLQVFSYVKPRAQPRAHEDDADGMH